MAEHMQLPPQYVDIEEECKKNPELKMSDLQILKDWMHKQPHLPEMPLYYLVLLLHNSYYRIESAKFMMENFLTIRTHMPEIFSNRDPVAWKELRRAFSVIAVLPLVQRTKENYIMIVGKLLDPNPNHVNFTECLKYAAMTFEMQNLREGTTNGVVAVADATGLSFAHISCINITIAIKLIFFVQEVAPVRVKGIHVINVVPTVETIFNMVKPFIKKELIELIHFHKNIESAKKFIPIEALPNEMGGQAGPITNMVDDNVKQLEEWRTWFEHEEKTGRVNESLRVDKSQAENDMFGVDGYFKKLEID